MDIKQIQRRYLEKQLVKPEHGPTKRSHYETKRLRKGPVIVRKKSEKLGY